MCCDQRIYNQLSMTSSSVSFRITRTAEDLAQTITAVSQRLLKLEQRQDAFELQLRQHREENANVPKEELATLESVEQLLRETRELLQESEETLDSFTEEHFDMDRCNSEHS